MAEARQMKSGFTSSCKTEERTRQEEKKDERVNLKPFNEIDEQKEM